MRHKIIPHVVQPGTVLKLDASATALDAARVMRDFQISCVLVTANKRLAGIFTEHDLAIRVVAEERDPNATTLAMVMTHDPKTLKADDSIPEALELMRVHNVRHLPVVNDQGQPLAMVSVRNLYAFVQQQLEQDLVQRDAWIMGLADIWEDKTIR